VPLIAAEQHQQLVVDRCLTHERNSKAVRLHPGIHCCGQVDLHLVMAAAEAPIQLAQLWAAQLDRPGHLRVYGHGL